MFGRDRIFQTFDAGKHDSEHCTVLYHLIVDMLAAEPEDIDLEFAA